VGTTVTVYKYYASIEIHYKRSMVTSHARLVGVRDARSTLSGHHTIPNAAGLSFRFTDLLCDRSFWHINDTIIFLNHLPQEFRFQSSMFTQTLPVRAIGSNTEFFLNEQSSKFFQQFP